MSVEHTRVVTVLNEAGQRHIDAYAFYDEDRTISSLNAFVYDAHGEELKKFKARDFLDQSASGNGTLYSDDRVKFLRYTPTSYPYTVVLEKSYNTPDTAFIPPWYFADGYHVSTEKSNYQLDVKCAVPVRVKEQNLDVYGIRKTATSDQFIYTVENLAALKKEPYSSSFKDLAPSVKFALEKFHLKGVDGQARNWQEFGLWINNGLLEGQDVLDEASKHMVKQLVVGISDPKEKVKRVYNYLQNNTRYISVQLGIGGWKPISAAEVGEVKYGDCKGLTNYTKALLAEVGINSHYTVLYAGEEKRDLDPDFPSLSGNHVFLNIPLENEELWLECTSQEVPVNFLGTFSDDRYVLKVTPGGGQLVKSKKYRPEESKQYTQASIRINDQGSITANVSIHSTGIQYDQKYRLSSMKENEVEEHYKEYWSYVNDVKILKVEFENNKETIELMEEVSLQSENYISKAGQRWLFTPNVFNRNLFVPKRIRNRKNQLVIKRGYFDEDQFDINLPESITVEELLPKIELKTDFGEYTLTMEKISDNQIRYKRKLLIFPGTFPKERYPDFRDFKKKIARSDNAKIVFIKT